MHTRTRAITTRQVSAVTILFIIIILVIITGTALAIIISALSISLVLRFSIIISTANIYYTREVWDSNIKVNVYTIRYWRIIGYTLAVDILYGFVNVK